jgi:hypothetical protein
MKTEDQKRFAVQVSDTAMMTNVTNAGLQIKNE